MTLPAGIKRPVRAITIQTQVANLGLAPITQRLGLVGAKLAGGTLAELTPVQILSGADADGYFGVGSELALMCHFALNGARDYGFSPEIWAVAQDDIAGTASTQTITIGAGTASETSEIIIKIAGREIRAVVSLGEDEDAAALSLEAAIDEASPNLPVTPGSALNVVTCTARQTGVNGEDTSFEVIQGVAGLGTVVAAAGVAGLGAVDLTAALDVLNSRDYDIIATANHTAADVTDLAAHLTAMWDATEKKWRHSIMCETGTLATAAGLATAADSERQMIISGENFKNTPGEIAAYVGVFLAGEEDPNLPWNDVELPGLALPDAADVPTTAEIESGLNSGLFLLSANSQQTRCKIVKAVTSKTTQNAVPNYTLADFGISRALIIVARQVDVALALAYPRAKVSDSVKRGAEGVALKVLRLLEEPQVTQNVDAHEKEVIASTSTTNPDRIVLDIPASIVSPLNQWDITVALLLE